MTIKCKNWGCFDEFEKIIYKKNMHERFFRNNPNGMQYVKKLNIYE
jgi:hypothetical protein